MRSEYAKKMDRQDAQLILRLMLKDDFPQIWLPSWENRDLRQLPRTGTAVRRAPAS